MDAHDMAALCNRAATLNANLTARQLALMGSLATAPGQSVGDYAKALGFSAPVISRAVEGMREIGWATREQDVNDRRKVKLYLSGDGKAALRKILEG